MTTEALFPVPTPQQAQQATLSTPANDDPGMVGAWTEDDVLRVLWRHFASQSWAAIPQVTVSLRDLDDATASLSTWEARRQMYAQVGPGAPPEAYNDARAATTDRRIDMLLVRTPRKQGIGDVETLAIEVKVTRADFLNDVRNPHKQAPWRKAATRHAYAVPAGLVKADEVPEGSGLIAVKHLAHGWGEVEWVRRAPYISGHAPQLPKRVTIALAHRIASLEAHTRGWWGRDADSDEDPQALRARVKAAEKDAEKANKRAERAEAKVDAWRTAHALAAPDGHPCQWCGRPVKPLNPTGGWFKKWRHRDADADAPCAAAETAQAEQEARDAYDAADPEERRRQARLAHRWGHVELIEKEPWRAFITNFGLRNPGQHEPIGPRPADVKPPAGTDG